MPDAAVFYLYDGHRVPLLGTRMDRPYCTLIYDPPSRNLFVGGFSGDYLYCLGKDNHAV